MVAGKVCFIVETFILYELHKNMKKVLVVEIYIYHEVLELHGCYHFFTPKYCFAFCVRLRMRDE